MFPFYFSCINSSMISQDPGNSINLSWNMWNARNSANSIMYMTPSFNAAIFDFPEVMMFGNSLLDPRLAVQQTLNSFNNGNWMNGANGGNNWMQDIFKSPWGNSTTSKTEGETDEEKIENEIKDAQYDKLKKILESYSENSDEITTEEKAAIKTALDKSGSISEKLNALKAAYNKLNSKELRKALLSLEKTELSKMGYNFDNKKFSFKIENEENEKLTRAITTMDTEIAEHKYDTLQVYVPNTETNDGIMELISYWNDEHKDDNNRSIIRYIASKFPSDDAAKQNAKETISRMVESLINKAKEVEDELECGEEFTKAHEALLKQLKATNAKFEASSLKTLATKFEEVYARIRIAEAKGLNEKLQKDYSFLNDISSSDTDFVNDNLVVEDVKADLEAEGIKTDNYKGIGDIGSSGADDNVDNTKSEEKQEKEGKEEVIETISGLSATGMRGIANENGMTSTGLTGYYQKGKHYYKYNEETQEMELLSGVTKVNNDGTVVKNGQTIAVKEVESPEVSGKILRQKLAGNTEERDYTIVRKKLNSFSLYDDPEEIVKFLKAYDDERSCLAQYNSRITAQIVTENGINDADKENYIKMIAEKVLLVAEKANIGQDDDIMQDLQEIANGTHEVKFWSYDFWQWDFNNTKAVAKKLDKLIDQVIDKYDELSAEDKAADTDETES